MDVGEGLRVLVLQDGDRRNWREDYMSGHDADRFYACVPPVLDVFQAICAGAIALCKGENEASEVSLYLR